ncbi:MAG: hypothetical protein AAF514_07870, partial [Verrucomicrobiota bacterium]
IRGDFQQLFVSVLKFLALKMIDNSCWNEKVSPRSPQLFFHSVRFFFLPALLFLLVLGRPAPLQADAPTAMILPIPLVEEEITRDADAEGVEPTSHLGENPRQQILNIIAVVLTSVLIALRKRDVRYPRRSGNSG